METNGTRLANMSSFHGHTIITTLNKLKKAFGKYESEICDKVSAEFSLQIDDVIFTIYDYREHGKTPYRNQDLEFNFHIGGFSKEQTEKALEFIKTKLK